MLTGWISPPWARTGSFSGEVGKQLECYLFLVATRSGGAMAKAVRRSKIWEQTTLVCSVLQPTGRLLSSDMSHPGCHTVQTPLTPLPSEQGPVTFPGRRRVACGQVLWGLLLCGVSQNLEHAGCGGSLECLPSLGILLTEEDGGIGTCPFGAHVTWFPQRHVASLLPMAPKAQR